MMLNFERWGVADLPIESEMAMTRDSEKLAVVMMVGRLFDRLVKRGQLVLPLSSRKIFLSTIRKYH
jgi:hypothetical protein